MLDGEPAWRPQSAKRVVKALASSGAAVVGVELWRNRDGRPEWLASSDYRYEPAGAADQFAASCAAAANAFIDRFQSEPEALFNLTWRSADAGE